MLQNLGGNQSDVESAAAREILVGPYISHYIVAILSPFVFICMIAQALLLLSLKSKIAQWAYIVIPFLVSTVYMYICMYVIHSNLYTQVYNVIIEILLRIS